jgi:hypothetical protein
MRFCSPRGLSDLTGGNVWPALEKTAHRPDPKRGTQRNGGYSPNDVSKRWVTHRYLSNSQSKRPFDELTIRACGIFSKKCALQWVLSLPTATVRTFIDSERYTILRRSIAQRALVPVFRSLRWFRSFVRYVGIGLASSSAKDRQIFLRCRPQLFE